VLRDPLPHPIPAAAPYAAIAGGAALAATRGDLTALTAQSAVIAAVIAGLGAGLVAWARRITICDRADRWIAGESTDRPDPAVEAARRRELASMRHRRGLAAGFRRIQRSAQLPRTISAQVPGDARVAAACAPELNRLTRVLEDGAHPVDARAVARAERLICEPSSPLHRASPPRVREARQLLSSVLNDLERMD
jgi:hypothetical protein